MPTDSRLFEPGDPVEPEPPYRCGQHGPTSAWCRARHRLSQPVCNRPPGHDGPHRYYSETAGVAAIWG